MKYCRTHKGVKRFYDMNVWDNNHDSCLFSGFYVQGTELSFYFFSKFTKSFFESIEVLL